MASTFSLSPSLTSSAVHLWITENALKSFEKSACITDESRFKWHVSKMAVDLLLFQWSTICSSPWLHVNQWWHVETSSLFLCHIFILTKHAVTTNHKRWTELSLIFTTEITLNLRQLNFLYCTLCCRRKWKCQLPSHNCNNCLNM